MDLLTDYRKKLHVWNILPEDCDPDAVKYHLPFLKRLDQVENSSIAVYDMAEGKYLFLTDSFKFLLDYNSRQAFHAGPTFFFELIHPDDLNRVLETTVAAQQFLLSTPAGNRKDYKLCFDFRIKRSDGRFVRMVQQNLVLEQDRKGNVWLVLIINDLSPDQNLEEPLKRFLLNMKTGKYYLFSPEPEEDKPELSKREIEILGLISQGYVSREIADILFISVNTVNNHRRNILEKMNVSNSSEAVTFAGKLGLI